MRFTGCMACIIVAFDCAATASGAKPQTLFAREAMWLWWVFAVAWGAAGFRILLEGAE